MGNAFTIESEGYSRYLFRRAVLPKLGWAVGGLGMILAALALVH